MSGWQSLATAAENCRRSTSVEPSPRFQRPLQETSWFFPPRLNAFLLSWNSASLCPEGNKRPRAIGGGALSQSTVQSPSAESAGREGRREAQRLKPSPQRQTSSATSSLASFPDNGPLATKTPSPSFFPDLLSHTPKTKDQTPQITDQTARQTSPDSKLKNSPGGPRAKCHWPSLDSSQQKRRSQDV